jgi:hypothetical protein
MPSIVSGFEYDIFISYRHNDNRSGWVTDFVNALQEELAATIKEPLSIYFDKNPHDGLLETHDVDKSLEGKLKCLIFIPILSQTYCDSKSFAWQHEFCAFNKLVQTDQFGRDIKVLSGNVASRILPIKVHDLDFRDKLTIENELGGALRAIEFIFKYPGVNRPLTASDNPDKNQNSFFYRDQINKVANGIKEILNAMGEAENPATVVKPEPTLTKLDKKRLLKTVLLGILVTALSSYIIFSFVDIINLTDREQLTVHKIILPLYIGAVFFFVYRESFRRMGQLLLQFVSVAVFGGGVLELVYTFASDNAPREHYGLLGINPENASVELIRFQFIFLRTLGTAMMAVGIGAWFLLRGNLTRDKEMSVLAVVLMFSLTQSVDGWAMYSLGMSFFIYSILYFVMTWAGAVLWWKGSTKESLIHRDGRFRVTQAKD